MTTIINSLLIMALATSIMSIATFVFMWRRINSGKCKKNVRTQIVCALKQALFDWAKSGSDKHPADYLNDNFDKYFK